MHAALFIMSIQRRRERRDHVTAPANRRSVTRRHYVNLVYTFIDGCQAYGKGSERWCPLIEAMLILQFVAGLLDRLDCP